MGRYVSRTTAGTPSTTDLVELPSILTESEVTALPWKPILIGVGVLSILSVGVIGFIAWAIKNEHPSRDGGLAKAAGDGPDAHASGSILPGRKPRFLTEP
jgi:hypothetical protein